MLCTIGGSSERQLGQIPPRLGRDEIIVQMEVAPAADPRLSVDDFLDSLDLLYEAPNKRVSQG